MLVEFTLKLVKLINAFVLPDGKPPGDNEFPYIKVHYPQEANCPRGM
jgi:hypothetical protein